VCRRIVHAIQQLSLDSNDQVCAHVCVDQAEDPERPHEPGARHAAGLGQAQRDRAQAAGLPAGEDQE
jgi:hypothetical protein